MKHQQEFWSLLIYVKVRSKVFTRAAYVFNKYELQRMFLYPKKLFTNKPKQKM